MPKSLCVRAEENLNDQSVQWQKAFTQTSELCTLCLSTVSRCLNTTKGLNKKNCGVIICYNV